MNLLGGSYQISALDPQQVQKGSIRPSSACAQRLAPGSSSPHVSGLPGRSGAPRDTVSKRSHNQQCDRSDVPAAFAIGSRRTAPLFQCRVRSDCPTRGASLRAVFLANRTGTCARATWHSGHCCGPQRVRASRVAHLSDTSHPGTDTETYNSAYWRGLALPWGGLFGTPRDAVRFAAAFLPSGERVVSDAATLLMTTDQTMGVPGGVESAKVHWPSGYWGLGWEVKGEKRRHWTGDYTSKRTFCHFGHAGTLVWGDPERDLALAVFANRTVTHMWGFILPRWQRLSNAVVAAAGE